MSAPDWFRLALAKRVDHPALDEEVDRLAQASIEGRRPWQRKDVQR